jgi:acyl-coenzyme A synthetase/AMP-(fatty) acid ligase
MQGGVTNICYNALDRHVAEGHGATPCLLFEGNDPDRQKALTYAETLEEVCKLVSYSPVHCWKNPSPSFTFKSIGPSMI